MVVTVGKYRGWQRSQEGAGVFDMLARLFRMAVPLASRAISASGPLLKAGVRMAKPHVKKAVTQGAIDVLARGIPLKQAVRKRGKQAVRKTVKRALQPLHMRGNSRPRSNRPKRTNRPKRSFVRRRAIKRHRPFYFGGNKA